MDDLSWPLHSHANDMNTEKRYTERKHAANCVTPIYSVYQLWKIILIHYFEEPCRGKNYTYYRSIHVFFMQELYFVAFISFAALFFIYEHLKPPASAFYDFNKE
jgi:hypothetical protein